MMLQLKGFCLLQVVVKCLNYLANLFSRVVANFGSIQVVPAIRIMAFYTCLKVFTRLHLLNSNKRSRTAHAKKFVINTIMKEQTLEHIFVRLESVVKREAIASPSRPSCHAKKHSWFFVVAENMKWTSWAVKVDDEKEASFP